MFLRFILLLLLLFSLNLGFSETLESISTKIASSKQQISDLNKKIRDLSSQKSTLENTIKDVNILLSNLKKDLEITEADILKTESI